MRATVGGIGGRGAGRVFDLPEACFTVYTSTRVHSGQFRFDRNCSSSDSHTYLLGHEWDWDDGSSLETVLSVHDYAEPGVYSPELVVTDGQHQDSAPFSGPEVTVTNPVVERVYQYGDPSPYRIHHPAPDSDIAYALGMGEYVTPLDVSDPSDLVVYDSFTHGDEDYTTAGIARVHGDTYFQVFRSFASLLPARLYAWDVSDPSDVGAPLGYITIPDNEGNAWGLAITDDGDYAVVMGNWEHTTAGVGTYGNVIDVSDPSAMVWDNRISFNNANDFLYPFCGIYGDALYMGYDGNFAECWDISDPTAPAFSVAMAGFGAPSGQRFTGRDVWFSGDQMISVGGNNFYPTICHWDLSSDPLDPTYVDGLGTNGANSYDADVLENGWLVVTGNNLDRLIFYDPATQSLGTVLSTDLNDFSFFFADGVCGIPGDTHVLVGKGGLDPFNAYELTWEP